MRSTRQVETTEVLTDHEMRAILDLAVEKQVERTLAMLRRAGVLPDSARRRSDSEFEGEVSDLR